jgi:diguanylate cyclase (GGDEF)-like protein
MSRSGITVGSLDRQNPKRPTKIVILAVVFIAAGAISVSVIWGAFHKSPTFAAKTQNNSHSVLLAFLGVATLLTMAVPAKFLERQRAEQNKEFPVANDPLIESETRRELFNSLEMEIKRSRRSQRSFAFLRVQINGAAKTSIERSRVAGDKAVSRLAQVLEANCRELDTVVRWSDDEFAVVLPEAGPETVRQVTRRIRERLAGGRKLPPIAVRFGAAMFPEEGKSMDILLEAANRALYEVDKIGVSQASLCA